MEITPTGFDTASLTHVDRAHAALNAAYNALAVDRDATTLPRDVGLAQRYVREAHDALTGSDGPSDASAASRAVLPRLEHALQLLDALGTSHDPRNVAPLLDEIGLAMDHVESALAAVGWD